MLQSIQTSQRRGVTIIELLVVFAVISMLTALLLPAVQQAREAARRLQCKNNLKQLGLGMHHHHDTHRTFPPAFVNKGPYGKGPYGTTIYGFTHGWAPFILPFIEQQQLNELYRWDFPLYHPVNQPVVSHQLAIFQCPSTPDQDRFMKFGPFKDFATKGACGDYATTLGVDAGLAQLSLVDPVGDYRGALTHLPASALANLSAPALTVSLNPTPAGSKDIRDGLSNTILLTEDAGRPRRWLDRASREDQVLEGGSWNHFKGGIILQGKTGDGTANLGTCSMNCSNNGEVYSFHTGGAHTLFVDGSVHFRSENISIRILARLITRAGGEPLSSDDY